MSACAMMPTHAPSSSVTISVPEEEQGVSILGEKLVVERADGTSTYSQPGRPVADISNVMIEHKPAPVPPAKKKK